MNDRPTADELLEAVQEYLRDEVAPEAPILAAHPPGSMPAPVLHLPSVPPHAEVDRLLRVYEAWVHVDVATPLPQISPEVASSVPTL